jgi:hypothetical protein
MISHSEVYQHLEEVKAWVQDMHAVWERKRAVGQITIPKDQIVLQYELEFDIPPELLWDYLNKPEFRNTLNGSDRYEIINRTDGRTAPGSVYQCYHGDMIISQTLLEWQPFEHMVIQQLIPIPIPNTTCLVEFQLIPNNSGTRYVHKASKPEGPLFGRLMAKLMLPMMNKNMKIQLEAFKKQVEDQGGGDWSNLIIRREVSSETIREAAKTSLSG